MFTGRKAVLIAVILGAYQHLKLEIVRKIFSANFMETIDLHKYRHCKLFTLSMYQFLTIRIFTFKIQSLPKYNLTNFFQILTKIPSFHFIPPCKMISIHTSMNLFVWFDEIFVNKNKLNFFKTFFHQVKTKQNCLHIISGI